MEARMAVLSNFSIQTSNFIPRSTADGDQIGIHAIPVLQGAEKKGGRQKGTMVIF